MTLNTVNLAPVTGASASKHILLLLPDKASWPAYCLDPLILWLREGFTFIPGYSWMESTFHVSLFHVGTTGYKIL